MRYDTVLWDIDNTLLDFGAAQSRGIRGCMARRGRDVSEEEIDLYDRINRKYWEMLERGEVSKRELEIGRFREFLEGIGAGYMDAAELNDEYEESLGDVAVLTDGAEEICRLFFTWGVRQYAVTNGTAFVQRRKIGRSGLDRYLAELFISEELGAVKPQKAFFERCAGRIPRYCPSRTLIIGDSLTSDMRGGRNAGIDCCWYNPGHAPRPEALPIRYEIARLGEAAKIVKGSGRSVTDGRQTGG